MAVPAFLILIFQAELLKALGKYCLIDINIFQKIDIAVTGDIAYGALHDMLIVESGIT